MREFVFQSPWALVLLVILIPLAFLLTRARTRRKDVVRSLGGSTTSHPPTRDGLRLAALALAIIALARPGIDPHVVSLAQSGRDVVFAMDVSRSMLAEDVAPSRLEAAKQAVRDTLVTLHGQRVGLVVYAGSATILCPLTDDYDFIRYMLDQANPDTVDFGGTQWQSAIDKITGQVFDVERRGFSDLVLLTDGDDQGAGQERVAEALREAGAGLLLVGLGDAGEGAKIPLVDTDGRRSWIEAKGDAVRTRMNREALTALAASLSGARFFEAGTTPFDLGKVFSDYVTARPTGAPAGGALHVVYRELAFGLIAVVVGLFALAHHWPLRWRGRPGAVMVMMLGLVALQPLSGQVEADSWRAAVAAALVHQEAGRLDQAIEAWAHLVEPPSSVSAAERAVVALDRGLALAARATQLVTKSSTAAWADASLARDKFLAACRLDPNQVRAGKQLDSTAKLLAEIQVQLDVDAKQNREQQAAVGALIERIKALLKAQEALREHVPHVDRKRTGVPPSHSDPMVLKKLVDAQGVLSAEASVIQHDMADLDRLLSVVVPGLPPVQSVLQEPLEHMAKGITSQVEARDALSSPDQWTRARQEQGVASGHFRAILALLATNKPSDEGEGDDSTMNDEESADAADDETESAQSASILDKGDKSQSADIQPLPKPNYTSQDIIQKEAANQQFRQQKRASAQAGKVEKDW